MKAKGIWAEAAKIAALNCYNRVDDEGRSASGFIGPETPAPSRFKLDGFSVAMIERLVKRWSGGDRLAEESLAALFELIVERGDPVPRVMRNFAVLRIRGEALGRLKKSPWEHAERDNEICLRIEELRRADPRLTLYSTRQRKGNGTSAAEIVAGERGMEPRAIEAIWRKAGTQK